MPSQIGARVKIFRKVLEISESRVPRRFNGTFRGPQHVKLARQIPCGRSRIYTECAWLQIRRALKEVSYPRRNMI
jgi:hypothetical protein